MATVLIVDDHPHVRRGLVAALQRERELKVLADTGDAEEAVNLALSLHPDVVLLDPKMGNSRGTETCRKIVEGDPSIRILILTSYIDDGERLELMRTGASAYLLKDIDTRSLGAQIKAVCQPNARRQDGSFPARGESQRT